MWEKNKLQILEGYLLSCRRKEKESRINLSLKISHSIWDKKTWMCFFIYVHTWYLLFLLHEQNKDTIWQFVRQKQPFNLWKKSHSICEKNDLLNLWKMVTQFVIKMSHSIHEEKMSHSNCEKKQAQNLLICASWLAGWQLADYWLITGYKVKPFHQFYF